MEHNFSYIQSHLVEWSLQGYVNSLGYFFLPLMFCAVIGYVYFKQQSYVAAVIAALVLFSVFGEAMLGVEVFTMFLHLVVALVVSILFLVFLTRRRG